MTQREELLPCPFCGGRGIDNATCGWIYCESCDVHQPPYEVLDDAIAAWNRRALVSSPKREDDLQSYFERQIDWSRETFGPALRTKGVIDHIRKELREIEQDPHDLSEWIDVVILAMDGFWRHGGKAADLLPSLVAKQQKNMARTWPDWRTMSEHQAIEHDRSGDATPPIPTAEEHERGIVAALVKLAEAGIPVDMQELLIKQNALPATLYAYLAASGEDKL